jgi:hypothetical protein
LDHLAVGCAIPSGNGFLLAGAWRRRPPPDNHHVLLIYVCWYATARALQLLLLLRIDNGHPGSSPSSYNVDHHVLPLLAVSTRCRRYTTIANSPDHNGEFYLYYVLYVLNYACCGCVHVPLHVLIFLVYVYDLAKWRGWGWRRSQDLEAGQTRPEGGDGGGYSSSGGGGWPGECMEQWRQRERQQGRKRRRRVARQRCRSWEGAATSSTTAATAASAGGNGEQFL